MCNIRNVDYEYIKQLKIHENSLILPTEGDYYILIDKNIIRSIIAVKVGKNKAKLHYNYTYPKYRGKGYFSKLLAYIINKYKDFDLYADCLSDSRNIYKKNGFEEYNIKQFKYFTNYYMRLLNGKKTDREAKWQTKDRNRQKTI